ncbi:MAG TPA: hypothetical protein PKU94_08570, partial [Candidatus Hydrothermia bacterium]|nr:hypothetical protein [Candidatus Hydrothermia bacterium]
GWTSPKVRGYGAPIGKMPTIGESKKVENNVGDVNLQINVSVDGAGNLDEKELAEKIAAAITDPSTLKKITGNPYFIRRLDEEYGRYYMNEARRGV